MWKINNKKDPQRSTALEQSVKKLLEGLNMFNGTCANLTLSFKVDQET